MGSLTLATALVLAGNAAPFLATFPTLAVSKPFQSALKPPKVPNCRIYMPLYILTPLTASQISRSSAWAALALSLDSLRRGGKIATDATYELDCESRLCPTSVGHSEEVNSHEEVYLEETCIRFSPGPLACGVQCCSGGNDWLYQ